MKFNSKGYPLRFVQRTFVKDKSAHLFTKIFKFKSPITKLQYVLRAEYHEGNVFAVKFYAKQHKRSDFKYSKVTNKGDIYNILISCLNVVPILLAEFPKASFGLIGARTVDFVSGTVEGYRKTQRFIIYKEVITQKVGTQTFEHFEYPEISGYLLINRRSGVIDQIEKSLIKMFVDTYENLLDV